MSQNGNFVVSFVEFETVDCAACAMNSLQGTNVPLPGMDRGGIRIEYAKNKVGETNKLALGQLPQSSPSMNSGMGDQASSQGNPFGMGGFSHMGNSSSNKTGFNVGIGRSAAMDYNGLMYE